MEISSTHASPLWRPAEWSLSFPLGDARHLPVVSKASDVSYPADFVFSCCQVGIFHTTHLMESLVVNLVTEGHCKHPLLLYSYVIAFNTVALKR